MKDYNKSIEINPNHYHVYNNIGLTLYLEKSYENAFEELRKSIILNPNFHEAYITMGMIYSAKKMYDEAIDSYNKAISLKKYNNDIIYNNIGVLYMEQYNYTKALYYFNKAAESNPYNLEAYANIGKINMNRMNYNEALYYFEKVEEYSKSSNNIEYNSMDKIYYGIGCACYKKKLKYKAFDNLKKSYELGYKGALSIIKDIDIEEAKEYIKNKQ